MVNLLDVRTLCPTCGCMVPERQIVGKTCKNCRRAGYGIMGEPPPSRHDGVQCIRCGDVVPRWASAQLRSGVNCHRCILGVAAMRLLDGVSRFLDIFIKLPRDVRCDWCHQLKPYYKVTAVPQPDASPVKVRQICRRCKKHEQVYGQFM